MINVAIVDDERTTIDTIIKLANWKDNNMEVIKRFSDGIEIIEYLKENNDIDLILTDVEMPGKSGLDVLAYINENKLIITTIVISAYNNFQYVQHSLKANAADYILKPIDKSELNLALRNTAKEIIHSKLNRENIHVIHPELLNELKRIRIQMVSAVENDQLSVINVLIDELLSEEKINDLIIKNKLIFEINSIIEETVYKYDIDMEDISLYKVSIKLNKEELSSVYTDIFSVIINKKMDRTSTLNIENIKKYIDRNFKDKDIGLSKIADEFHISNGYLSRLFKDKFDQNLTEYIIGKKMDEARKLILEEHIEIKHAAETVGYEDISYFYRVWKKKYNTTPKMSLLSKNESDNRQ